jgi:hypothetical protein
VRNRESEIIDGRLRRKTRSPKFNKISSDRRFKAEMMAAERSESSSGPKA